jgi:hypothetical protein
MPICTEDKGQPTPKLNLYCSKMRKHCLIVHRQNYIRNFGFNVFSTLFLPKKLWIMTTAVTMTLIRKEVYKIGPIGPLPGLLRLRQVSRGGRRGGRAVFEIVMHDEVRLF